MERKNPYQSTLPIDLSGPETLYRQNLFNAIDRTKTSLIRMQDFLDHCCKTKELFYLTEDLPLLENAYLVLKMLQLNNQEQINR